MVADSHVVLPSKKVKKTNGTKKSKSAQSVVEQQLRPSTEIHDIIGIGTVTCCNAVCYDMSKNEILNLGDFSECNYDPQVAVIGRTVYLVGG